MSYTSLPVSVISHVRETVSTNTDARAMLAEHPDADTILRIADIQTGGRGRQGKSFHSPEGGLYMTLVLRTHAPLDSVVNVTSCSAVAVARALGKFGADVGIKWVNDLYLNDGKVTGILVESVNDYAAMRSEYILIGVGVNVRKNIFPEGIPAVTLEENGIFADIPDLCAAITRELLTIRENRFDFCLYADEYRRRSVVLGREVTFTRNNETFSGVAEAIDDLGGLIVRVGTERHTLNSGEITLRIRKE